MTNNYDKIARYYDRLSRLVFFKAQVNAQINQLKFIPENSRILIVGGGTGWILEELTKVYPAGLKIVYIEISEKMIELSKKRNTGNNTVEFVNSKVEDFSSLANFDVISTPFLFDNFPEEKAGVVFEQLNSLLQKNGLWLFVDFTAELGKGRCWKSAFLKLMYGFFKLIGIVEASKLTDMNPYFKSVNYKEVNKRAYYGDFIQASVYQKTG